MFIFQVSWHFFFNFEHFETILKIDFCPLVGSNTREAISQKNYPSNLQDHCWNFSPNSLISLSLSLSRLFHLKNKCMFDPIHHCQKYCSLNQEFHKLNVLKKEHHNTKSERIAWIVKQNLFRIKDTAMIKQSIVWTTKSTIFLKKESKTSITQKTQSTKKKRKEKTCFNILTLETRNIKKIFFGKKIKINTFTQA